MLQVVQSANFKLGECSWPLPPDSLMLCAANSIVAACSPVAVQLPFASFLRLALPPCSPAPVPAAGGEPLHHPGCATAAALCLPLARPCTARSLQARLLPLLTGRGSLCHPPNPAADAAFMSWSKAHDGWFPRYFPALAERIGMEAAPAAAAKAPAAARAAAASPAEAAAAASRKR